MQLVIDVNAHRAIQGIGLASPVNSIGFKSQDTPALNVYFVDGGVVQDLGESPVLKFGLVVSAAPTVFLSYDADFARHVDPNGLVYYSGFPVFNTTQMATALGTLGSIACVGEIRYQLSDAEIIHVLDIPFTVFRTILVEGGTPDPTEIPGYPDVSLIELKSNKGIVSGYAPLDANGKIPASAMPPLVVTTASFVVPIVNFPESVPVPTASLSVGSMYGIQGAGLMHFDSVLDASHGVFTATVDTRNNGATIAAGAAVQLAGIPGPQGASALLLTQFIFTVPAFGGTTNVAVPTGTLNIGALYSIQGAGLMVCISVTDALNAIFKATLDTQNAGASIPIGAVLQLAGANASTLLGVLTDFTVPALGGNAYLAVTTATMVAGSTYSIAGAGLMLCVSIYDATNAFMLATADTQNAGAVIPVGSIVELAGPTGPRTLPFITGFIETPTAKSYTLILDNPFAVSLSKLSIKLLSGTCTASLNINGTPVPSAGPIAVTSTLQQIDFGGPQALAPAALLELVISSPTSPVDLAYLVATA